jgi:hypothetical protein
VTKITTLIRQKQFALKNTGQLLNVIFLNQMEHYQTLQYGMILIQIIKMMDYLLKQTLMERGHQQAKMLITQKTKMNVHTNAIFHFKIANQQQNYIAGKEHKVATLVIGEVAKQANQVLFAQKTNTVTQILTNANSVTQDTRIVTQTY